MVESKDPAAAINRSLREESAGALGRAGRRLRLAVRALAEYDGRGAPRGSHERRFLLDDAAEALWAYVIQKEQMGVPDNDIVNRVYGVTPEIWKALGAVRE